MYSQDGTQITLYLDGVGVPVTQSQRKLTLEMAKMAHDFYEARFNTRDPLNPSRIIDSRTTWEIGQSARISGVYTGPNGEGHDYLPSTYSSAIHGSGARGNVLLFAGMKTDKTLLAIGLLSQVTDVDGSDSFPYIRSSTKSVTFKLYAIETKLVIDDANSNNDTSFKTASGQNGGTYDTPSVPNTKANNMAEYVSLGGVKYPYYKLPKNASVKARYCFFISPPFPLSVSFFDHIKNVNLGSIKPEVIKREPRFLSGGQYYYVRAKIDTGTTVKFDLSPSFVPEDPPGNFEHNYGAPFVFRDDQGLCFIFDTESQGGIFSFTFRFPVCNLWYNPTIWYLQPGFGRDLFSLDNGVDAGGCILMGTEDFSDDIIEIYTK